MHNAVHCNFPREPESYLFCSGMQKGVDWAWVSRWGQKTVLFHRIRESGDRKKTSQHRTHGVKAQSSPNKSRSLPPTSSCVRTEDIRKDRRHTQGWKTYARMGGICAPKCSPAVLSSKKEMRPIVKSQPESLRQLKQHERRQLAQEEMNHQS